MFKMRINEGSNSYIFCSIKKSYIPLDPANKDYQAHKALSESDKGLSTACVQSELINSIPR